MEAGSSRSPAPEPLRPAGLGTVPLVGGARPSLVFIGGGLIAMGLGAGWLAWEARHGWPVHLHPRVIALSHVWLPGFLLSVCIGASYQLMPVVLGTSLRAGVASLWAHAVLHAAGMVALVIGLAGGSYAWVAAGGVAISAGAIRLFIATLRTFAASSRRDAAAWSFPLAGAWLTATVLAGVLLALNRRYAFLPISVIDLLRMHAHLGLAGYFLTLLQGVTFQLVPMFTLGQPGLPRWASAGLLASQTGLLLLAPGLCSSGSVLTIGGALLLVVGVTASGAALIATLRTRRRRLLDPGVRAFVIGGAAVALSVVGGAGLTLDVVPEPKALPFASAYGLLGVPGGLSLMVLGMLCKILPFLVWMKAYGPRLGREPVPMATALSFPLWERTWLLMHLCGIGLLVTGTAGELSMVTAAGGLILAFATGLYLLNAARVFSHLRINRRVVPRPGDLPSPLSPQSAR